MNAVWPISVITFKEGIRNRAIYGIFLLALLLLGANFLVCSMIMRDVGKVAVDVALSSVSFSGVLLVLFVGINLMAKDLDRRTIYMVLSRPVSRQKYILGKFLGMVLLLLAAVSLLSLFALLSIFLIKLTYADYFVRFSWGLILLALVFIFAMLVLLTALSFLFASFASTSFVTLVLTIVSYLIGHSVAAVKALVESPGVAGIEVSPATVKLVQVAYYAFPNLSLFNFKTQAAHALPVSAACIFWTSCYALFYSGLAVTLAALIFRKKEFP